MPPFVVPDDYWTIAPRGFAGLVARFAPAFDAAGFDLQAGAAPVVNGNDLALRQDLASVDGDRDTIRADAAAEVNALATTPTGQAVAATSTADGKIATGDDSASAASAYQLPGVNIPAPPPLERDQPPEPGGTEPPPPDPNAPPPPIVAQITALYEELLGREPDGGGLSHWLGEIAVNHHDLAWVREQIMLQPEYLRLHGAAPPPPAAEPPPAPPPEPAPIDMSAFVTHEQLAAVVDGLDLSINLWV